MVDRPLRALLAAANRADVTIHLNQPANADVVDRLRPDTGVWAAGAEAIRLAIDGLDTVPTLTSIDYYLEGRPLPGSRVLIVGGGLVGIETAERLALEGREVVVVELLPEVGGGMEAVSKNLLTQRIEKLHSVTVLTSTTLRRIGPDGIEVETPQGFRTLPPVDAVLLAVGLRPRAIPETIRSRVREVHVIGDAKAPRDVERAMKDGYEAGLAI
jgi:pyruvate/2-oxoglutarate dehydrogenase complex dihydrolipoamide dehydrogenase (E3) component